MDTKKQNIFLSDPQQLNSYSYASNNPLRYTDPNGLSIIDNVGQYMGGFNNAYYSNYAFGFGRNDNNDFYYSSGQRLGDAVSFSQGLIELMGGALGTTGGTLVTATGIGAPAGAVTIVGSSALAAHGTQLTLTSGSNLFNFSELNSGGNKNNSNNNKQLDISNHARIRMQERGISQSQVQKTVENNKPFDYYHERTWKQGYYDQKTRVFVGQVKDSGRITTVIDNVKQSYINNLKSLKP